ncbi:MAG TPA: hypothetical protein VF657_13460 [Actinoplanes sp.]
MGKLAMMEARGAGTETERELLKRAEEALRSFLPSYLTLTRATDVPSAHGDSGIDAVWELGGDGGSTAPICVQAKSSFTPKDAQQLRWMRASLDAAAPDQTLLVVSPWLSARSRELLADQNISYLDLSGNVLLRSSRPAVFVHLQGEDRNPSPKARRGVTLQGPKAQRLARLLVDFAPPYRLKDLAGASGLSLGYVSRLLETLQDQALVDRSRRGAVEQVDWPALLRESAKGYVPTRTNLVGSFVAPAGAAALYRRLTEEPTAPPVVVTGSFAAVAVAPIAAPSQLMIYTDVPAIVQNFGRLLPAERGANVLLLRDGDVAATARPRLVDGIGHVALSQLVMDCANGPGRLPEEGAAVLEWMQANEEAWRNPMLVETLAR